MLPSLLKADTKGDSVTSRMLERRTKRNTSKRSVGKQTTTTAKKNKKKKNKKKKNDHEKREHVQTGERMDMGETQKSAQGIGVR